MAARSSAAASAAALVDASAAASFLSAVMARCSSAAARSASISRYAADSPHGWSAMPSASSFVSTTATATFT